jgi:hypothetical protein
MKKQLTTIFVFLVFALVGFLSYKFLFTDILNNPKEKYTAHNRVLIETEFEREFLFDVVNDSVYRGMELSNNSANFFVSDFGDYFIKQFDLAGNFVSKIGNGYGRGPGEFQNITDFDVSESYIWAADMNNFRISRFSIFNASDVLEVNTENMPARIATNGNVTAVKWMISDQFFTLFNNQGEKLFSFGKISDDQVQNAFTYDGWIDISENHLFFIPISFGQIFVFKLEDGELIRIIDTPENSEKPELEEQVRNNQRIVTAPSTQYRNSDILYIPNKNLLAVSSYYRGNKIGDDSFDLESAEFWIDFYDLNTWKYRNSISLPHAVSSFFFFNEILYTYNTTSAAGRSYKLSSAVLNQ